jgi:hypothetical protein
VPPPILQPPSLSASQFGFWITGLPNLAVNIESSTNLSSWVVNGTYPQWRDKLLLCQPQSSPGRTVLPCPCALTAGAWAGSNAAGVSPLFCRGAAP